MKYTINKDSTITCEHTDKCGSCRVKEHSCHDCLPGDTLVGENGLVYCIGCGEPARSISEGAHLLLFSIHEECRKTKAASIAHRFGMIDGAHHKQWVIDQILRVVMSKHRYEEWLAEMNSNPEYDPWDHGIAP